MNYECLPFELFPTPVDLEGFVENEIDQARESLDFHKENLKYFRQNIDDPCVSNGDIRALVSDSKYNLEVYRDAKDELDQGNTVLAELLLDRKIRKLNKQVNEVLFEGRKCEAEEKLFEMNCLRQIKKSQ